jgi:hypothetical protein
VVEPSQYLELIDEAQFIKNVEAFLIDFLDGPNLIGLPLSRLIDRPKGALADLLDEVIILENRGFLHEDELLLVELDHLECWYVDSDPVDGLIDRDHQLIDVDG